MIAAALLLIALVSNAEAQAPWDGNRLYAACGRERGPSSDCAVVIRGIVDRYHERIARHCAPRNVLFGDIVEHVVSDLDASPATRGEPAADLVLRSIGRAYGCRLTNPSVLEP